MTVTDVRPEPNLDEASTPTAPPDPTADASPRWFRPAHAGLLLATAVAYLWSLGASGWANAYYSAAVQAGTQSWKAMLFGSFDAANAITVDKPPASLWLPEISARIFGVSSWSILVPEALMGVATVALVVAIVRRWFRPGAALLAGAVVALTPVAALMFRFNNPDALLVLLLTAGAYAVTRAVEDGRTRWLVLAGSLVGFGFLAKMMQAFVVLPAFALAYVVAGPPRLRRRIAQLAAMGAATLVAGGWWVAIVELWPASSRPFIGGSQNNSVLDLMFGYNGLGRLTGNETGSVGGGAGNGTGRWGATGLMRLFNADYGGQASWLIPAALIATVAGLVWTARRPRTDRTRAALLLWGSTLVITGLTISLSQGIIHTYYTVALAPAIGVLVGIGASLAWQHRTSMVARGVAAATIAASTLWSAALLSRTPSWNPWLRPTVLAAGAVTVVAVLAAGRLRAVSAAAAAAGVVTLLAAPAAYSLSTIATAHTGALPTAGPRGAGGFGGPGGRPGGIGGPGAPAGGAGTQGRFPGGQPPAGGFPAGGAVPGGAVPGGAGFPGAVGGGGPTGGGGMGGLLDAAKPSAALVSALTDNASHYTWVAAAVGANSAAGYQLATNDPVLAIGGFNGTDPSPTLAEFQALVTQGRIHYFIGGGGFGAQSGGSDDSSAIASWVQGHYAAKTVGGVTLYDLTAPTA